MSNLLLLYTFIHFTLTPHNIYIIFNFFSFCLFFVVDADGRYWFEFPFFIFVSWAFEYFRRRLCVGSVGDDSMSYGYESILWSFFFFVYRMFIPRQKILDIAKQTKKKTHIQTNNNKISRDVGKGKKRKYNDIFNPLLVNELLFVRRIYRLLQNDNSNVRKRINVVVVAAVLSFLFFSLFFRFNFFFSLS